MDVSSYQLNTLDDVIDRIDEYQDVDVVLVSEEIVNSIHSIW